MDSIEVSHADFMLKLSETALLNRLGSWNFQMNSYGEYNPDKILKMDFEDMGEALYESLLKRLKEPICKFWVEHSKSGLFEDSKDVYFGIIGLLFGANVPIYSAMYFGALLLKRGLNAICDD